MRINKQLDDYIDEIEKEIKYDYEYNEGVNLKSYLINLADESYRYGFIEPKNNNELKCVKEEII